jgi:AP-4 complex subunit epsilon-1
MLDTGLINLVRRRLQLAVCDRDPSVMAATLPLLITALPAIKDIAADNYNSSLLCILQQILDSKLPRSFEYCGVSAPWVQVSQLGLIINDKNYTTLS